MFRSQATPTRTVSQTPSGSPPPNSDSSAARGQAAAEPGDLQRLSTEATNEVRQTVRTSITELFGNFLKRLPAALTAASKMATTAALQSSCLKLARSVASEPDRWLDTYLKQVDARLARGATAGPQAEDRSAAFSNDEVMSLANVELRAEGLHQKLVAELEMRFDRVRRSLHLGIYTKALAPAGLCRALHDTADILGLPAKQRVVLFEKFDEMVVAELQRLYRAVLETVEHMSVSASLAVKSAPVARINPDSTLPRGFQAPAASALKVDFKTVSMLENSAASAPSAGYGDGSLANDLLTLASNEPLPGLDQKQNWIPLQRMKIAGEFLNEALADPFIPEELSPQHESVRFPLVKSALTDSTLFTAVTHPLRSLVNELMLKSATSRITGSSEMRRMAELLQEVLVQFDLAPEFVREAMLHAQPIPEEHIKKFFESQRQQALERRQTVLNQAKRVVIQELEQATFGRGVPPLALKFLNTAWGPLLVKRLLLHGADHALRKEGVTMMEQLLDFLDEREPDTAAPQAWLELVHSMGQRLAADGMAAERVSEALAALETARRTPR